MGERKDNHVNQRLPSLIYHDKRLYAPVKIEQNVLVAGYNWFKGEKSKKTESTMRGQRIVHRDCSLVA
jgi:hypothetical protein